MSGVAGASEAARGLPVSGEPLFENDYARGWMPARPLHPEHVVIECRGEWRGLEDLVFRAGNEALAGFFRAVGQAAQSMGLSAGGYRLVAEERGPGGEGPLLVHLIPGGGELGLAPAGSAAPAGLAEQDISPELRTLVLPPQGAPSEAQVGALAAGLGIAPQAAAALMGGPLPRAVARRPKAELAPLEARLNAAGVAARLMATRQLLAPFRPWLVERVELAGRRETDGLRVFGPEGEAAIDFDRNALLVVGRYSWLAGGGTNRSGWSSTKLQTMRHTRFVHLWFARAERPFSFVESSLTSYEFLGERRQPSVLANFQLLIDLLDDKPRTVGSYALAEHALHVKAAADSFLAGLQRPSTPSPDAAADLLSRVYFQLTLGDPEARQAAPGAGVAAAPEPPPDTLETWLGLGEHHARAGDQAAARAAFEAALRKQPGSVAALVGLSRTRAAPEEALRDLARALELVPESVEALCERGRVLLGQGDVQAALADFGRVIQLRPGEPQGWRGLGAVYLARGDREGAITAFTAAIQADPADSRSWVRRGVLRLERDEAQLGLQDLAEALRLDPALGTKFH